MMAEARAKGGVAGVVKAAPVILRHIVRHPPRLTRTGNGKAKA